MSDVIGYVLVEPDMDAYSDIFTSERGAQIGDMPKAGTAIRAITNNLLINWRSAAYVAGMPPQYVLGIETTLQTFAKSPTGNTELLNLAGGMLSKLTGKVPELFADPDQRRKVHTALVELGALFQETLANTPLKFDREQYWNEYLQLSPFQQYVWSSERLSYQAVYNSYEEFFVECARVSNELPRLRASGKENGKDAKAWFREAFGEAMLTECWTHPDVNRVRLIRHSLAHAGGKVTADIKRLNIEVRDREGVIHMFPGDVRKAIATLGDRVIKIIDAANPRPEFG